MICNLRDSLSSNFAQTVRYSLNAAVLDRISIRKLVAKHIALMQHIYIHACTTDTPTHRWKMGGTCIVSRTRVQGPSLPSVLSVYVYFVRRMSFAHTYIYSPHISMCRQSLWPVNTLSAPATADTLDCTRSPLPTSSHFPTGSLLLEGEALSSMCADVRFYAHKHARLI